MTDAARATAIELPGQAMTDAAAWVARSDGARWQRGGVIPLIHRQFGVSYSIQIQESARLKVTRAGRVPIPAPQPQGAPCVYAYAYMRTKDPGRVPKNIAGVFRFPPAIFPILRSPGRVRPETRPQIS
jgi:hypothetical protein